MKSTNTPLINSFFFASTQRQLHYHTLVNKMENTDLQMFMANLKQLIYGHHIPFINNPFMLSERPQFQLLYKELDSIIQTLSNIHQHRHHLHELEKVRNLEKSFKDTVEEAQDIIDTFLSAPHFRNIRVFPTSDISNTTLDLENVMRSIKTIKVELMAINNMKMDSSPRIDCLKSQSAPAAGTSCTRNPFGLKKQSEEIIVGFNHDAELIWDELLVKDRKQLDVVSMVGMGGLGLRMFLDNLKHLIHGNHDPVINSDPLILSERPQFQLLYQELASIVHTLFEIHEDHHHLYDLEEVRNLRKRFKYAAEEAQDIIDLFISAVHLRYRGISPTSDVFKTSLDLENVMISIDSIKVEIMAINKMKRDSPPRMDRRKSQSAAAAGTCCTRNHLGMNKQSKEIIVGFDRDAELIRDKLVEDQKKLDMVSIVGMGGLGKTTLASKVFNDSYVVYHFRVRAWVTVSQTYEKRNLLIQILTSSGVHENLEEAGDSQLRERLHKHLMGKRYLIVIDDIWSIEAWDKLKLFFPNENTGSRILLTSRINEVALHAKPHGFIHSLPYLTEEQSWELLKEKVFNDELKACKLHDLVRELCLQKAKEERFFLKIDRLPLSSQLLELMTPYKQHRMFTNQDINDVNFAHPPYPSIRTLICFNNKECLINNVAEYFGSFALLRVLDLQMCELFTFSQEMALMVHLRYLAIWIEFDFPSSICNLRSLQTLIVKRGGGHIDLPSNISDLVNLRHLWCGTDFYLDYIDKPMNLQSISHVSLGDGDGVDNLRNCFPNIRKLGYNLDLLDEKCRFESLPYIESLKLRVHLDHQWEIKYNYLYRPIPQIWFPATLKKLTLLRCCLPWSEMSIIEWLPNLEVLKLKHNAFLGPEWDAREQQFPGLKFLRLDCLDIKGWDAFSTSFPCLKRLSVRNCLDLKEIPLDIGEIATLELIEIHVYLNYDVVESLKRIQKEQHDEGNTELEITVNDMMLSIYLSEHKSTETEDSEP